MVYNVGHTKNKETNTENIKDNTIGAQCIPNQSIQHRRPTL